MVLSQGIVTIQHKVNTDMDKQLGQRLTTHILDTGQSRIIFVKTCLEHLHKRKR